MELFGICVAPGGAPPKNKTKRANNTAPVVVELIVISVQLPPTITQLIWRQRERRHTLINPHPQHRHPACPLLCDRLEI